MIRALFALTLLGSALLVFQVQPMLGKAVLPSFGGSPSTWTACMVFFQVALLAGYLAAHRLSRAALHTQVTVFVGLLLVALVQLPVAPPAPRTDLPPLLAISLFLAAQIGVAFVALSMTAPLVSSWFARATGREPYALYAASNLGSMLGLLGYPLLVEPALDLTQQVGAFRAAFTLVLLGIVACGVFASRVTAASGARATTATPPSAAHTASPPAPRITWLLLAAVPSALLLAVTNHITVDVAAVPFLWVLPLALYLATFIATFASPRAYDRRIALPLWVLASGAVVAALFLQGSARLPLQLGAPLFALTIGAWCCHGELARLRPEGPRVTELYLWIAAGGALGALFVALIAPQIFDAFYELHLALVATYVLVRVVLAREPAPVLARGQRNAARLVLDLGIGLVVPLVLAAAWTQAQAQTQQGRVLAQRRSFHGLVRVTDLSTARVLTHGRIRHGMQWRDPDRALEPTMYFGPESGSGLAFLRHAASRPRQIGVVGLGVGTLASYGREGDSMRFYELSPDVAELARRDFSFLARSQARTEVVIGDGRLSLEHEPAHGFDLLVADAFASDSVPVHLLTHEAFDVYAKHLRADGLLLVNVSNRHLQLERVVAGSAEHAGLQLRVYESAADDARGYAKARWALLARDAATLDAVLAGVRNAERVRAATHWTDRFSNVLGVLR